MHGHMPPQQHPGMHPAHQPPPHLTHLSSLPPHNIQRDHPANRLNNGRHHHPRGVDHQAAAAMAPHLPMQVPPPPHPQNPQNARKPPGPSYYGMHGGSVPKSMPLNTPHLHPSQPGLGVGPPPPQQPQPLPPHQQHMAPMSLTGPGGKLPYGLGNGASGGGGGGAVSGSGTGGAAGMAQHQPPVSVHHSVTMQAPPPIPVVSAATPAGTKTRHIPSNTDHKVHHSHGHNVLQSNGNCGPSSKGIANMNQPASTMDKTKASGGGTSGSRHHNHHHNQHQQQQHILKSADVPLPKDSSAVIAVTASAASAVVSVASALVNQTESSTSTTPGTTVNGGGGGGALSVMTTGLEQSGTAIQSTAGGQHSPTDSIEALANIKEKTTMCLVNELARYNKIQHQYRLTGESGPAHKKHFTVTLKLGDEEYTAEGASIKKAQHKAAGDAIAATKYKHPPARTNRRTKTGTKGNVSSFTPTVELNALAMKRGEPTVYTVKAVPVPVSKYGPTAVVPPATGGRRPMEDKSTPRVGHNPAGMGYGTGQYAGESGTGAAGTAAGGSGYWCRTNGPTGNTAGVGGRGGMGGFHPGHQQQQQQQQQHHGHHPRDEHQNRHHAPHNYHHHHQEGYGGHHHHGSSASTTTAVQEFYKATLRVGERTFLGEGHTPQAARHDAAARALEVLKPLTTDSSAEGKGKSGENGLNGETTSNDGTSADGYDPNAEVKSPISLVHEIAVQRSLSVVFEVISEKGPPHMTVFVTQCKVGTIVTEGEGTGKKLSKKRAAEKMLEELRKLQSAEQQQTHPSAWGEGGSPGAVGGNSHGGEKRKSNAKSTVTADGATAKKKARNLIKEKSLADVAEKENPISRLMQIQQARKEKQPVYTLVENDRPNVGRRRQFTIEVSAGGRQATGVGMTKKAAKWNAAEALLVELGYVTEAKGTPSGGGEGVANKENQSGVANDSSPTGGKRSRKVRFQDEQRNGVPSANQILSNATTNSNGAQQGKGEAPNDSMNDSVASNDSMGTNSSGVSSASSVVPKADIGAKKEQLLYLAQLLKFEVQFSDFPKGNHGEYLTLVILSTEPPQLCHGNGASLQESHDAAARGALEMLSKIGLDNVKPKASAASSSGPDDTTSSSASVAVTATPPAGGTLNSK
ncbi:double-stranded RNA-binding protein Staufen homolog [Anopheles maculipalpis]|uniref:double-stranded RNA-binding protein Staufen homolog n=1 Tax=Anopheles maculipalpis TaxID=1496333 RepID=UPI00215982A6|nr:double-stranded RNA-binding protein Staufen homolog [Anopheles maculipalpis]